MEIIIKKILLLFASITIFSFLCILAIFINTNILEEANADSLSGEGISINYVGESEYSNNVQGAIYKVTMPQDAQKLYIAFEDDWEWIIGSEEYEEGDIPYIDIEDISSAQPDLYVLPTFNLETQKKEAYVTIKSNGDLYAKCTYEDDSFSEYFVRVNVIDWAGPKILIETEDYWLDFSLESRYITHYSVAFSDIYIGLRYPTASSGIKRIEIFYILDDLSEYVNDSNRDPYQENITLEEILEKTGYTFVKDFISPAESEPIDFQLSDSGYYYYAAEDYVGNITLGLIGKYTQLSPEGFNIPLAIGGNLNIYQYLVEAQYDINENADYINANQTNALQAAIDRVYYTFLSSENVDERNSDYNLFVNQWAIYKEAILGAFFTYELENEGAFLGEVSCVNFNENTVNCIKGDSVVLSIKISKTILSNPAIDSFQNIIQNHSYNTVYKVEYELRVNGLLSNPKVPLIINFSCENNQKNILVIGMNDEISPQIFVKEEGINYFRVFTSMSNGELYIFLIEESTPTSFIENIWVWIVMGCFVFVSALIIIAFIFLFIVRTENKN